MVWMERKNYITEEQYREIQRTGMWEGKPILLQRRCEQCNAPIGQHNKPHNKRPTYRTDKRCYACVEVVKVTKELEEALKKRRLELEVARRVRNVLKTRAKINGQKRRQRMRRKREERRA